MTEKYDMAIIGGGPAGLTAAIYACRAGLSAAVFSPQVPGSQLVKTNEIENFPGFPDGISGYDLLEKIQSQAAKFGAEIIEEGIISVSGQFPDFVLKTDTGRKISAKTVIIASGAVPKLLGLPEEENFIGRGVSYCAVCDGFFFRNKTAAVIGGGDTAFGDALYLANFASKVYLVHRRDKFRAADAVVKKAADNAKIEFVMDSVVRGINGDDSVQSISVQNVKSGTLADIAVNGVFIAVGQRPVSDLFSGIVKLSDAGTIESDCRCRTSVPGIFAAGDVSDALYRQAIIAAGAGAKASLEAIKLLTEN
ncbi:MAG: thioredoxin-disulfide reductase [Elusimicrobiales bacterium]|nr:thioredoxin-disulfide reductase [Elusimicrobiales bacterium]